VKTRNLAFHTGILEISFLVWCRHHSIHWSPFFIAEQRSKKWNGSIVFPLPGPLREYPAAPLSALRWRRDFITLLGGAAALDKDKTKGASMVTDPKAAKVVKMVPVDAAFPMESRLSGVRDTSGIRPRYREGGSSGIALLSGTLSKTMPARTGMAIAIRAIHIESLHRLSNPAIGISAPTAQTEKDAAFNSTTLVRLNRGSSCSRDAAISQTKP
jgi:hypothetical protein